MKKPSSDYVGTSLYDDTTRVTKENLEGIIVGPEDNAYKLGKVIGSGTFGELRYCLSLSTNQMLAVKIEPNDAEIPQLKREYEIYARLRDGRIENEIVEGVPRVYYFGPCGQGYKAMVMDLLGPSLQDLFQYCDKRFSLKTVLMIAVQLIRRLEYIHFYGLVYRDIKPENFLIGKRSNGTECLVWIVDFGLAKDYIDKQGKHIRFREQKPLTGTARYMSVNTHFGLEQSRRDDLEGLAYMFLYFLKGSLPWQGLKLIKTESSKQKYRKIAEMKRDTSPDELCEGYPDEFKLFLRYARGLDFVETPDYTYLTQLFEQLLFFYGWDMDYVFDWTGRIPPSPQDSISGAYIKDGHQVQIDFRDQVLQRHGDPKPVEFWSEGSPNPNDASRSFDVVWPPRDPQFLIPQRSNRMATQNLEDGGPFALVEDEENNYREFFTRKIDPSGLRTSTQRVFHDRNGTGPETGLSVADSVGKVKPDPSKVTFASPHVQSPQRNEKGFLNKICNCCCCDDQNI